VLLSERSPITAVYHVEVSGWDVTHLFFVEKSVLEWNEETGKRILLHHALPQAAMIFVRLLESAPAERAFPVAYEASFKGHRPDGRHEFLLKQAQPHGESAEMVQ